MESGQSRRRIVALVAAYAVALQALLSAFVPMAAAMPADPWAVLCSHDGGEGRGQQPANHDMPCAAMCAAMAQGVSGPLPPVVAAIASPPQTFAEIAAAGDGIHPRIVWIDSHAPRGPPSA